MFEKMARGFWTNNKEQRALQTRENVNNQDALCFVFAPDWFGIAGVFLTNYKVILSDQSAQSLHYH